MNNSRESNSLSIPERDKLYMEYRSLLRTVTKMSDEWIALLCERDEYIESIDE